MCGIRSQQIFFLRLFAGSPESMARRCDARLWDKNWHALFSQDRSPSRRQCWEPSGVSLRIRNSFALPYGTSIHISALGGSAGICWRVLGDELRPPLDCQEETGWVHLSIKRELRIQAPASLWLDPTIPWRPCLLGICSQVCIRSRTSQCHKSGA